ncbi:hypothetical protein [Sorangium sp. So ce854]|uniref:hypothetical protein n=1 Tax=Sorangium sp. So ce854 TaxID=3133322 RepID=UPI003F61951A
MRAVARASVFLLLPACAPGENVLRSHGGGGDDVNAAGAGGAGSEAVSGTGGVGPDGAGGAFGVGGADGVVDATLGGDGSSGGAGGGAGAGGGDGAGDGGASAGVGGAGAGSHGAGAGGHGAGAGGHGAGAGGDSAGAGAHGAGAGAPDCSGASAAVTGDVLDPDQVYLAGTLLEGACGRDAVAHWSSPDSAVVGFHCHVDERSARIRPTDGRLLYTNVFEDLLREFHCDDCPSRGNAYPEAPLDNDPVLPTPRCADGLAPRDGFLVSPTGAVLYRCSSDTATWYDERGRVAHADPEDPLLHLGHGDLALAARSVVHLATSTSTPITGLPGGRLLHTVRARAPDRFLLVLEAERPTEDGGSQELWEVDGDGVAARLGAFPPLPAGAVHVSASTSKLDGCGALLQFGGGIGLLEDVIVRRDIGGASEVVYTEATEPLVKIHVSALVTGP